MDCPNTPNTIIDGLLDKSEGILWERSWKTFYDIYYPVMAAMARNSFAKMGMPIKGESDLNEIISNVFMSLLDAFSKGKFVKGKYRFRGFLKRLVFCRAIDFARAQKDKYTVSIDALDIFEKIHGLDEGQSAESFKNLEKNEEQAYRYSVILDIWENIRHLYSPATCLAFEMTKLEGRPVAEVCEKLGVNREKIDKSVHRIIKRISEEKEKEFYRRELSNE